MGKFSDSFNISKLVNDGGVIKDLDGNILLKQVAFLSDRFNGGTNMDIDSNVDTKIPFDRIVFDTHNAFDTDNSKYIIPFDGLYYFSIRLRLDDPDGPVRCDSAIYLNGEALYGGGIMQDDGKNAESIFSCIAELKKGDEIEVYYNQNSGSTKTLYADTVSNVGGKNTLFLGFMLGGSNA